LKPGPDEAGLTYEQIIEKRQKEVDAARWELWPLHQCLDRVTGDGTCVALILP
jgi:hypothetical protein